MNEILITGSAGVVGRRAIRELLAAGYGVTGVTRSARGREQLEIDAALVAAVGVGALRAGAPQDGPPARSQRVSSRRLREASGWAPRMRAAKKSWGRIAA